MVSPAHGTRLLLSVINAAETAQIKAVADVVDVKNPARGPLGAPDISIVRAVLREAGGAVPVSASLGDAENGDIAGQASLARAFADEGVSIVKIAVARLSATQVERVLSTLRLSLPMPVKIVAAVYADAAEHDFISTLPERARCSGADGILLDTAVKNGKPLFGHMSPDDLRAITASARSSGLFTALAGGLGLEDMENVAMVNPDYAGFRSAIATNGRGAEGVDVMKARRIKKLLGVSADAF